MVHMGEHTYYRVGRYTTAEVNEEAIAADEEYLAESMPRATGAATIPA